MQACSACWAYRYKLSIFASLRFSAAWNLKIMPHSACPCVACVFLQRTGAAWFPWFNGEFYSLYLTAVQAPHPPKNTHPLAFLYADVTPVLLQRLSYPLHIGIYFSFTASVYMRIYIYNLFLYSECMIACRVFKLPRILDGCVLVRVWFLEKLKVNFFVS